MAELDASPSVVLVASPRDIVDADSRPIVRDHGVSGSLIAISGAAAVRRTIRSGTNIFGEPGCVLMRRADLEAVGWWDSRWPYLIDETTYAKVLLRGDFASVGPKALAGLRLSDSQWSVRLAGEPGQRRGRVPPLGARGPPRRRQQGRRPARRPDGPGQGALPPARVPLPRAAHVALGG